MVKKRTEEKIDEEEKSSYWQLKIKAPIDNLRSPR